MLLTCVEVGRVTASFFLPYICIFPPPQAGLLFLVPFRGCGRVYIARRKKGQGDWNWLVQPMDC